MTLKQYERITRELRSHVFSFVGEKKSKLAKEIVSYQKKARISPSFISTQLDLVSREGYSLGASSGTAVVAPKLTKENPRRGSRNNCLERDVQPELENYFLGLWRIYIKYFPTRVRAEEYLYYRFSYQLSDRQKQLLLL